MPEIEVGWGWVWWWERDVSNRRSVEKSRGFQHAFHTPLNGYCMYDLRMLSASSNLVVPIGVALPVEVKPATLGGMSPLGQDMAQNSTLYQLACD